MVSWWTAMEHTSYCMCMCIYVYVYIPIHTVYVLICVVKIFICLYTLYKHISVWIHICMFIQICVYICIFIRLFLNAFNIICDRIIHRFTYMDETVTLSKYCHQPPPPPNNFISFLSSFKMYKRNVEWKDFRHLPWTKSYFPTAFQTISVPFLYTSVYVPFYRCLALFVVRMAAK